MQSAAGVEGGDGDREQDLDRCDGRCCSRVVCPFQVSLRQVPKACQPARTRRAAHLVVCPEPWPGLDSRGPAQRGQGAVRRQLGTLFHWSARSPLCLQRGRPKPERLLLSADDEAVGHFRDPAREACLCGVREAARRGFAQVQKRLGAEGETASQGARSFGRDVLRQLLTCGSKRRVLGGCGL